MTLEEMQNKLIDLEQQVQGLRDLITNHGLSHELPGHDIVRPSVQNGGTQLNRHRTLNFAGTALAAAEDSANKRITVTGTKYTNTEAVTAVQAADPLALTNSLTVGGNISVTGHSDGRYLKENIFAYISGQAWIQQRGYPELPASQTGQVLMLPLNVLKVGDEIVTYVLKGRVESGGNAVTVDCKLVRMNYDCTTFTDVGGGGIAQVSQTGNYNFAVTATLDAVETISADYMYFLEITSTTAAGCLAQIAFADVQVNRKV